MAQLRDAQTSELLAEGSPLEIATAAESFAAGEVTFDGVGALFDPAEVRQAASDELAGLNGVLDELGAVTPADQAERDDLQARTVNVAGAIAEREQAMANGQALVGDAAAKLEAVRERVARLPT